MLLARAVNTEPNNQENERDERCQNDDLVRSAIPLEILKHIAQRAGRKIGDRDGRQAFDGGLRMQVRARGFRDRGEDALVQRQAHARLGAQAVTARKLDLNRVET